MKTHTLATLVLVLLSFPLPIHAQWVQTNGPYGGFITCFVESPNGAGGTNLFAGTWGGGVFFSTNNGTSWSAAGLGNTDGSLVRALAVSPNGAGGTNLFAGTYYGVFLSTNNDTSWTKVLPGLNVWSLASSGTNLFASMAGGVFLSTSNGASWSPVNTGLPSNTIPTAFAVSPNGAGGTNLFAGMFGGVFLSTNNGTSWTTASTGLPNATVFSLTVGPNGTGGINLFAGTDPDGVFISTNNGTSWTDVNAGLTNTVVRALAVSSDGAGGTNLFAGTGGGVFLSKNNGTNWTEVNTGLTSGVSALAVSGSDLFAGTSSGVWRRPLSEMITSTIPATGLQMWLKADAGVDTLNGKVSRWHDQSGNGNDAVQANASRQPLLVPGTLNGKPVISFDGLNDKLGFTGATPMTQFSLFLVINNHSGSVGNTGSVLTFGANGNFWYMGMAIPDYGVDTLGMAVTGGNFGWVRGGTPGLVAHDKWRNLSVVLNQTIWNTTLQWDGNNVPLFPGGNAGAISVPLGDATGSGGGIGGADGVPVGTILAQCDVAEVIVYNVALSDAERKKIEYNLAVKYGLPLTFLGVAENPKGNLAERYVLEQNYPNPFNPSTTIRFQILNSSQVKLKVFDIVGREVATLVDERLQPGSYETTFNAKGLASGVYLYRLQAGNFVETKRLILLK